MELTLKGEKLRFFDSIQKMPIKRLHEFEKALLVLAGVGADMTAYDAHFQKLLLFIDRDKKDEAKQELFNQRQNFFFLINSFSVSCYAFVYLIDNKKEYTEATAQEEMARLLNKGLTSEMVEGVILEVKKKYLPN